MKLTINSKKIITVFVAAMLALSAVACSGKDAGKDDTTSSEAKTINLEDLHKAVENAYGEDYLPDTKMDEEYLKDAFGLSSDMYEEVIAEATAVSVHIDTFVAVKAKEGQADAVETALNTYRDGQINDAMMYPTNAVKIQGSQVVRHGDYVFYVCLGSISEEAEEKGDDAILAEAKEQTQKAVDVIQTFFE